MTPATIHADSDLLIQVASTWSPDNQTQWLKFCILTIDQCFRDDIANAYRILDDNPSVLELQIQATAAFAPGPDFDMSDNPMSPEDALAIQGIEDEDEELVARAATPQECALFDRIQVPSVRGLALVVGRFLAPYLACHERYEYEQFESHPTNALAPPRADKQPGQIPVGFIPTSSTPKFTAQVQS